MARQKKPPVISLVSLGCAKNLVDSERILGQLAEAGFLIAQDPAQAEICLVNTCGFIGEARQEAAGVLAELAGLKERGALRHLLALGCLVERARAAPALARFLSAADVRVGFKDFPRLAQICRELALGAPASRRQSGTRAAGTAAFPGTAPRLRIGSPHTAYLKISEGCSNPCRFCAIPRIRGPQVSRPIAGLVAEARELVAGGAVEINLIAQDTTSYGRDLYGQFRLAKLLRALLKVKGLHWLRLMYAYPKHLTAEMLDVLAGDERCCPYIDLPLQHISDPILARMGRGVTRKQTVALLDLVAKKLPRGAIRTAFIAGYPGETEKQAQELVDFVKEGRFAHAGVFLYSREPLTPAAQLRDNVPLAEKKARREALMLAQREVSRQRLRRRVGTELEVLVDGVCAAGILARSQLEAPEVDGVIYLQGRGVQKIAPGTFVSARAISALDYDLVARTIERQGSGFRV